MEFQKTINFIDITSDNKDLPRIVTKKWIEIYDQSLSHKETTILIKKLDLKLQC